MSETLQTRSAQSPDDPIPRPTRRKARSHRKEPTDTLGAVYRNRARIAISAANGLVAFLFGLAVETVFMRFVGLGRLPSYALQIAFSTQLSFLLARFVTWRDRRVPFFRTMARYNAQQLGTTLLSIMLFAGLDSIGVFYALANLTVTICLAPISFLVAHNWSLAEQRGARVRGSTLILQNETW
ncbi:MAG TPA: GtrA family protein [Trebonia sp.]|nr:GtrA family protein [Trebonia sp.]